ncbi:MAG: Ribonuclease [Candidatus Kaiserbacteria bacterium GW2011_GWB1_52_6]|uniref:Ribonuclease n=1 Tax=Candidatus Kaiserbacteria bacterium GW2011_GWB1_52_6 TaxID=1618674 RepID=A0A0G2A584_9BACT|nr:MAG: Ribonuclease [Candidatus Kaiserbacteria bacterium GW2011_GWB1_52_6]
MTEYIIGIDEVGRGALAGPVGVGAVLYPTDFPWRDVFMLITKKGTPKLKDSKQLTAQQRDTLFEHLIAHDRLRHAVAFVDAKSIDRISIVNAANEGAAVAIAELGIRPSRARVMLDAGLRVPSKWFQQSFVRGDETIPAISFASIIAKVMRDRYMEDAAKRDPSYFFEQNKGYSTLAHRKAIAQRGMCELHRATFCTRLLASGAN